MFSHFALISVELANSFWPRKLSAAPIGVFFKCEALFEAYVEHFVLWLQIHHGVRLALVAQPHGGADEPPSASSPRC